jgi:hypothetical protein
MGRDAQEEHDRQQHQRQGGGLRPEAGRVATSASAMIAADSTLKKTVARLCASFQSSDRAASRL